MKYKRVAAYVRASSEEQKKFGFTIETQKDHLQEYINTHAEFTLYKFYVDAGISANNLKKRAALQELLCDVESGHIDVIVFTKLDRWFRSVSKYYKIQDVLDKYGISWIATMEDYETTTSAGKFKVNIMLAVAQQERDRCSERIKDVFNYKVKNKESIIPAQVTPFGFTVKNINGKKLIVHDEAQDPILRDILNYYFTYNNKRKTRAYLNEKYNICMEAQTLTKLFKNPLLYGQYRGVDSYCEPYISKEQFDRLQQIVAKNIRTRHGKDVYIFSGLIKCPHCGATHPTSHLCGANSHSTKNNINYYYRIYRCDNHWKREICDFNKSITEDKIEESLLKKLKPIFAQKRLKYTVSDTNLTKRRENVNSVQEEINRLNIMFLKNRISESEYDQRYEELTLKLNLLKDQAPKNINLKKIDDVLSNNLLETYWQLSQEEKQAFWRNIIENIWIDDNGEVVDIDFL